MDEAEVDADEKRVEFSENTKKTLKAAAGGRCCHPKCLRETDGVAKNDKGELVPRGFGVAAHIYSAKKRGPRGQGDLNSNQIKSDANGLWTCANHGRQIDDFKSEYSADYLLRMKAVRELGHALQLHDVTVTELVKHVGVQAWNDCVWDHVVNTSVDAIASVDEKPIKAAFTSIAIQRLSAIDQSNRTSSPGLLGKFKQRSLAVAISSIGNKSETDIEPNEISPHLMVSSAKNEVSIFMRERTRAFEIAKSWSRSYDPDLSSGKSIHDDRQILLSARDPRTGETIQPGTWQNAYIVSLIHYSPEEGELIEIAVRFSSDNISELRWKMSIMIQHGVVNITSHLLRRLATTPYIPEPDDRIEFWNYCSLIEKIAAGWQPVGYVSHLNRQSDYNSLENLDSRVFEIECRITRDDLALMLARCEKVRAGLEIERRWNEHCGYAFINRPVLVFNSEFFLDHVDAQLMRSAINELIAISDMQSIGNRGWETGPLKMFNEYVGLCLRYNMKGQLLFARKIF